MNRRTFFKNVVAVVSGICMIPAVIDAAGKQCVGPLTQAERERMIAIALSTDAGRTALANAMVEPIRDQMEWGEDGLPCAGHDFNTMTKAELRVKYTF